MALAIAEGIKETKRIEVVLKRVEKTNNNDLLKADGIIVGSPTYYGQMSGKIKTMFDESAKIHGKLAGKVGAAFTSSGGIASGCETTIISILEAMLIHGMIIQGNAQSEHYGVTAIEKPTDQDIKKCREFGKMVAKLILKLES